MEPQIACPSEYHQDARPPQLPDSTVACKNVLVAHAALTTK
jgi:hypothetical protein